MAEPLTSDEIKWRLATDGRTQTRLWWATFAAELIATVDAAEAEVRALRKRLLRYEAVEITRAALAATADPTSQTERG